MIEVLRQRNISKYVCRTLSEARIGFTRDKKGCIWNFREGTPLISCHMDSVSLICPDKLIIVDKTKILGLDNNLKQRFVRGDDLCGVHIAIQLIKEFKKGVSFLFSSAEESSGNANIIHLADQIKKCCWGLVLDRRGNSDIIGYNNSYCTKEFESLIAGVGKEFGYRAATGSFSDADEISESINCVNISVGYYNPHSESEYINTDDVKNALGFATAIVGCVERTQFAKPDKCWGGKDWGRFSWDHYDDEYNHHVDGRRPEPYCQPYHINQSRDLCVHCRVVYADVGSIYCTFCNEELSERGLVESVEGGD